MLDLVKLDLASESRSGIASLFWAQVSSIVQSVLVAKEKLTLRAGRLRDRACLVLGRSARATDQTRGGPR